MKKNILTIISCFLMLLVATACQNQTQNKPTNLEDTYKAISYYFSNSKVDKSNLGSFYIDDEKNIIIVKLVENTVKNQETFLKLINVDKKYIEFKQGGPYKNDDIDIDIELSVAFDQTCGNIEFNKCLNQDDIKVYLEENINNLYITFLGEKMNFNDYANSLNQSLDRSIKNLTDKLEATDALNDGGTTIYKDKAKNITVIACHTLNGNKDVYIGDYQLNYKENMCK